MTLRGQDMYSRFARGLVVCWSVEGRRRRLRRGERIAAYPAKDVKQFGLERERKLADFIEENAATLSDLKQTFFLANRAGK